MNLRRILGTRIFTALANAIIRRSLRTPYTHLRQADGRAYMDRYRLFRIGQRKGRDYPWIGARVHHIQSSDDDSAFHDHPWNFTTIILRGGYTELRPEWQGDDRQPTTAHPAIGRFIGRLNIGGCNHWITRRNYTAGDILHRKATDWHALTLEPNTDAVTLFITWPQRQSWGFLWLGRKVPHRDFATQHGESAVTVSTTPAGNLAASAQP